MFSFLEWSTKEWFDFVIALSAVLALFILLILLARTRHTTRSIAYGAICVGLAFVLNLIRLWTMPQGGSVTLLRFLPLVIYAYLFGTVKAVGACAVYGVLDLMMSGWIVHPIQVLLDYIIGFACIGLCGIFRKTKLYFVFGPILAGVCRYMCLVASGVIFWGEVGAPFGVTIAYSLGYNAVALIDMGLVMVALGVLNLLPQYRKWMYSLQENR